MRVTADRLEVIDLCRLAYGPALAFQRERNLAVSRGEAPEALLLVEHEPVITVTHRKGAADHVLTPPEELQQLGIALHETDRGGDVTYHGPGQLVVYPILRLDRHHFDGQRLNLARYMRMLEHVIIETLGGFGVEGMREPGATGVWVGAGVRGLGSGVGGERPEMKQRSSPETAAGSTRACEKRKADSLDPKPKPKPQTPDPKAKLAALGVRVRKHTTMHGLALNVTTDLSHFRTIDPCGLGRRPVTSLQALLGEACPSMDAVKAALVRQFDLALFPSD